jgi:succinate dehydrogenase/fumarate reductase flavoprotein subunit
MKEEEEYENELKDFRKRKKTEEDDSSSLLPFPFYAIPTIPGVSFCLGGLKIDTSSRVVNVLDEAIPGLYALMGAGGGMHYFHMLGALASISSFAYIAAKDITENFLPSGE